MIVECCVAHVICRATVPRCRKTAISNGDHPPTTGNTGVNTSKSARANFPTGASTAESRNSVERLAVAGQNSPRPPGRRGNHLVVTCWNDCLPEAAVIARMAVQSQARQSPTALICALVYPAARQMRREQTLTSQLPNRKKSTHKTSS